MVVQNMKKADVLFSYDNIFIENILELQHMKIYQICELALMKNEDIPDHKQFCDEITYIVSGEGLIYSDGVLQKVSSGCIHFISKNTTHKIVALSEQNLRYICVGFEANEINGELSEIMTALHRNKSLFLEDSGDIRIFFEFLINELYSNLNYRNMMIETYMKQILCFIYRNHEYNKIKYFNPETNSNVYGKTIYKILKYIESNIMDITDVKSIAKQLSYSEYYISHLFKEKIGITIKEYIRQRKVVMAKEFLNSGKVSISEIAYRLNYDSSQSLSKMFKKQTGISLTEYQKKITKI